MVRLFFSLPYSPPLFFSFLSIQFEIATVYHNSTSFVGSDYRIVLNPSKSDQLNYSIGLFFLASLLLDSAGNQSCKTVHYVAKPDGA
jgi:hypothetical protein